MKWSYLIVGAGVGIVLALVMARKSTGVGI